MLGLELVVVLGVCILASTVASGRLRLAAPVLLVLCGAVLGFVPGLESVSLPPEAMLLIFLPALLYWESLNTSLREIRSNLRPIVLLSTLLVLATAGSVAAVATRWASTGARRGCSARHWPRPTRPLSRPSRAACHAAPRPSCAPSR
ncbi:cation:proton antiporter domain-containing protein [Lentzea indica]|uniref:cation:proton antiporter domain-containing protein n=1 Tax=Lentzea indica TaxID=2604800 RepID=UPI0024835388|nr:cation:proton antiporter [Lentzea indica]